MAGSTVRMQHFILLVSSGLTASLFEGIRDANHHLPKRSWIDRRIANQLGLDRCKKTHQGLRFDPPASTQRFHIHQILGMAPLYLRERLSISISRIQPPARS